MSKGGGTQTKTESIDPDLKAAYLANLNQARSVAAGLPVQEFAGFNPLYTAGEQQIVNESMTPFTGETIAGFQNPYTQDVINRSMADLEQQRQIAQGSNAARAIAAKAFGGSREGVQRATTDVGYAKTAGDLAAGLRSQGYDRAAQLAQYARQQAIQGGQTVLGLGDVRRQLMQQQYDAIRNRPLQQLQIAQSGLGQGLPNLGMTTSTPFYTNPASGALGGALAGAKIGSMVPGIGTGIGAGIGGLLGMFG